ncbi:gamma-glutamyltransferase [Ahniella affigens]|uniref:Glutathione hydrolase proenzyme n=1 Tax=Ahniella affigens TaxID=2021234 RepID=A0A2P1PN81_9GAMM|nr:gamma-glutamyltransferase [Ahniella affigens]AVP96306.1 gamma-glutamyltransferase [Ahniella affigens]
MSPIRITFARLLGGTLLLASITPAWAAERAANALKPGANAIASAHHLATDAGFEVLAEGGNAFDAAVAVSAALAVVEPSSSGLGGGGFWLLHRASDGRDLFIDGREVAPAKVDAKAYLDAEGNLDRDKSVNGALAAGIPGHPAALVHLAEQYGRLPLKRSLAPAIRLADQGFALESRLQSMIAIRRDVMLRYPASASVFLRNGNVPELGTIIKQPDLAKTFKRLAKRGAKGFYQGKVAEMLVAGVQAAGGNWQLSDLADYRVKEREPLRFQYRDYQIVSAPPPSSGGVVMATVFNILEGYDFGNLSSADQTHLLVESMRRAYRDRSYVLGDPDFVDMPLQRLTSKDYAAGLRAAIRLDKATPSSSLPEGATIHSGTDTTHFSVIDADGNLVAATMSVNLPMGSAFIPSGTGVILNNEMDDFALKANAPNAYGLVGTDANAPAPGKRMLSTMSPTFAFGPTRTAVIGTPGGSRIATMVLLGLLEFMNGKSAEAIVSRPRIHHQYLPDVISTEANALSREDTKALQARGHTINDSERPWGNMHVVIWDRTQNQLSGAADPRSPVGSARVEPALLGKH